MFTVVYTIFGWIVIVFIFLSHAFVSRLFILPFTKNKEEASHFSTRPFLKCGAALMGVKITVEGIENIPKESSFIIASNHQSLIDIAIYLMMIPRKFSFFAKKELISVPILGGNIENMGHFIVDRNNTRVAVKQMDVARKKLESGYNLLVFPEGTRTLDGSVGEFKKGAFMMAVQTGLPIIPTYIDGAFGIVNKASWKIHPGDITLKIGKPIPVQKQEKRHEKEAAEQLAKQARDAVIALSGKPDPLNA